MIDLHQIIAELRGELARVDTAIAQLEKLQRNDAVLPCAPRRGRKFMSTEERKQVSERMRQYWADRKKGARG